MNIATRFNKFFVKGSPEECWMWTGCKHPTGYGLIWAGTGKSPILAHRLALEIYLGRAISDGLLALHSCDNPSCVNPSHLREGTQQDNMIECIRKNRNRSRYTPKKLTWKDIAEIRSRVGQTQTSIAKEFGVSRTHITNIVNNRAWIKS